MTVCIKYPFQNERGSVEINTDSDLAAGYLQEYLHKTLSLSGPSFKLLLAVLLMQKASECPGGSVLGFHWGSFFSGWIDSQRIRQYFKLSLWGAQNSVTRNRPELCFRPSNICKLFWNTLLKVGKHQFGKRFACEYIWETIVTHALGRFCFKHYGFYLCCRTDPCLLKRLSTLTWLCIIASV